MNKRYTVVFLAFMFLSGNIRAQNYDFAIDQLQKLPPFFSSFMSDYTKDVNENINNSFFFATQSSSQVLPSGDFQIGLTAGGGFIASQNVNRPDFTTYQSADQIYFSGQTPSLFGGSESSELVFLFKDPDSQQPLINPFTGESVEVRLEIPGGLGLGFGATPSAAISLGYGLGFGTELKGYITPKFLSFIGGEDQAISFSKDMAYGFQVKHELTYWIPKWYEKGYHISLSGGYSSYQLDVAPQFLSDPFSTQFTDDVNISVTDNLQNVSYNLSTTGLRLLVGKSFKFAEITLSGGFTNNTFEMQSEGGLQVQIEDSNDPSNNRDTELTGLMDFSGKNMNWGYGAAVTLGQGWFRTALSYRYATTHYAALSLQFVIKTKKDRALNYSDFKSKKLSQQQTN